MSVNNSFHNRCARYITGKHIRLQGDRTWIYPNRVPRLESRILYVMKNTIYIVCRKNTICGISRNRYRCISTMANIRRNYKNFVIDKLMEIETLKNNTTKSNEAEIFSIQVVEYGESDTCTILF